MGNDEIAFAERVAERLEALGTNPFAVEKAHNLPPDAIRNVLRGARKAGTPINRVRAICDALDLEFYIGPRRTPDPAPPVIELDGDDFAAIPKLAVEASAGAGAFNDDAPEVVGKLAFRRDWLRRIGVKPDRVMLITVTGDSMEPALKRHDLVMIDLDRAEWTHNDVFAINDPDEGLRIKRVLRDRRGLVLVSDNPRYPPQTLLGVEANRIKPLGRVVWSGHRWE